MIKRKLFSSLIACAISTTMLVTFFPLNFSGTNTENSYTQNVLTSIIVYSLVILASLVIYAVPLSMAIDYFIQKFHKPFQRWMRLILYILLAFPALLYFKEWGALLFSATAAFIFWVITELYAQDNYSNFHSILDKMGLYSLIAVILALALSMSMIGLSG